MSKVYALIKNDGNPYDGITNSVLVITTNKAQLDYFFSRLKKCFERGELGFYMKELFSYKANNAKNMLIVTSEHSDISFSSSSIEEFFFDNEKGNLLANEEVKKLQRADDTDASFYIRNHPIVESLSKELMESILEGISFDYKEIETEYKMKQNGSYWQII